MERSNFGKIKCVGNGFKYLILNYLEEPINKESIKEKLSNSGLTEIELENEIERLTESMRKYYNLLEFLNLKDTETNGEQLLTTMNAFFEKLESNKSDDGGISKILEKSILNNVEQIFNETALRKGDRKLQFVNATIKD